MTRARMGSIGSAALIIVMSGTVFAQSDSSETGELTNESTLKIEDVKEKKNEVSGDLDQEVTNNKLRAESGSKSRYSVSLSAIYNGASLEKPLDSNRPNLTLQAVPEKVYLGGDIGVRYRIDKNNSLSLGTGYSLQTPFQDAKRGDISDPYVAYNYASRIGKVQNVATLTVAAPTKHDEIIVGTLGMASVTDTLMYDFNGSRLSVGLATEVDYNLYENNKDSMVSSSTLPANRAGNYQTDYVVAAYPLVEYAFTDKLNFRTVFRPWIYLHNPYSAGWTFDKAPWSQSIGVGYAVTRDIYLYPNFQFNWERWRADDFNWFRKNTRASSTVNLTAIINVF